MLSVVIRRKIFGSGWNIRAPSVHSVPLSGRKGTDQVGIVFLDVVTLLLQLLDLAAGMKNGSVVTATEGIPDLRQTVVGQLLGQGHRQLARTGNGAGTALLQMLYDKADRENMPIYLETHKRANVAYNEQRGFQLIHTGTMPGDDMPFWCMVREPNPDKA